jgi:Tfp pilus assembly protein FimT
MRQLLQLSRRKQRGVTITGLVIALVILIFVALLGFKLIPAFMEFRSMKNAISAIAREKQSGTVAEIRRAFESRQAIDDFQSVKATDLDISKQGNQVVIAFAYRKEVPLFANVGVYIDFRANTAGD